jgi:hypothetical protein
MTGKSKNVERYFLNKKAQDRALDIDINWEEEIKYDPRIQKQIDAYHPNHREKGRRKYLEAGPEHAIF